MAQDSEPTNYGYEEGDYLVSDRKLDEHQYAFNLTDEDIDKIPKGAKILNIGSGIHRSFETALVGKRPDLLVLSVDPSLGIVSVDNEGKPSTHGYEIIDLHEGMYNIYRPMKKNSGEEYVDAKTYIGAEAIEFDKKRKEKLNKIPGALAANATTIPLSDNCLDVVFDFWGPIRYLKTTEEKRKYMVEIKRVLKGGGKAYVSYLGYDEQGIANDLGLNYTLINNDEDEVAWVLTKNND